MRKPDVKHVMRARDLNVTYTIDAYRRLTRSELLAIVREYGKTKFDRPAAGNITISSMIGYRA